MRKSDKMPGGGGPFEARRFGQQTTANGSRSTKNGPDGCLLGECRTMDGTQDIYADGIGEITLTGGMVRIDLVSLSAQEKDSEGRPRLEFRKRIVLPPEGFLRSFSAMEDLVRQLVDAGLIKRRDAGEVGVPTVSGNGSASRPVATPNF